MSSELRSFQYSPKGSYREEHVLRFLSGGRFDAFSVAAVVWCAGEGCDATTALVLGQ